MIPAVDTLREPPMPDDWTARWRAGKRAAWWLQAVVTAALLIGTVPSVLKRIEHDRVSTCCSQLKRLGLALVMYVDDYDGVLPLVSPTASANLQPFGWAWPYMYQRKHERRRDLLHCPSDPADHRLGYALNARLFPREVAPGVFGGRRLRDIPSPSNTYSFLEAGPGNDGLMDPDHDWPVARHGRLGMNIAWLDGHVYGGDGVRPASPGADYGWNPTATGAKP